jgi:voltage-gated potassium channel
MTTVGYGDYVPVTFPGQVVAMFLMVFGIGVFVILTNFVAARLDGLRSRSEDSVALLREENAIIRAELAEIKELLRQRETMAEDETDT